MGKASSPASQRKLEEAQAHHRAGRLKEATALYRAIVDSDPELERDPAAISAFDGLALIALSSGQTAMALSLLDRLLQKIPQSMHAHSHRGTALLNLGRAEEGVAAFGKALELKENAANHDNLAVGLRQLGRLDEALAHHAKALAIDPGYATGYNNYAVTCIRAERYAQALSLMAVMLRKTPGAANGWHNLGDCLRRLGRPDLSIPACREALRLDPKLEVCRFNEALSYLLMGEMETGWPIYEARKKITPLWADSGLDPKLSWHGENLAEDQTLLIQAEQGMGDTLQFVRYLALAREKAPRIHLRAQAQLLPVLSESFEGRYTYSSMDESAPPHSRHAFLLSLPMLLRKTTAPAPLPFPYLRAPADALQKWRGKLGGHDGRIKIGLVWSGNPKHQNDRLRSMAFEEIAGIFDGIDPEGLKKLQLFSLQKGPPAAMLGATGHAAAPGIIDLGPQLHDFGDTAAALDCLDLVLSVDTSVLHLAGAMGRPCWTFLPHSLDWRWGLDGDTTPWYPSLRLFREPGPGNRAQTLARIGVAILEIAAGAPLVSPHPLTEFPRMPQAPAAPEIPAEVTALLHGK